MRNKLLIVIATFLTGCMSVNSVNNGGQEIPTSRGRSLLNKPIGKWLIYNVQGNIIEEGKYSIAGKQTGVWRRYDTNGTLRSEKDYDKGELNGRMIFYSESGVKTKENEMKKGNFYGKQIEYHANGNKRIEYSLNWPGKVFEICNSECTLIDSLIASEPVGNVLVFNENGELIEKGNYFRGAIWSSKNLKGEKVQCMDSSVKNIGWLPRYVKTGMWEYYRQDSVMQKMFFLGEEF